MKTSTFLLKFEGPREIIIERSPQLRKSAPSSISERKVNNNAVAAASSVRIWAQIPGVGQFDVEAVLRRQLARLTRRYKIKLHHYPKQPMVRSIFHCRSGTVCCSGALRAPTGGRRPPRHKFQTASLPASLLHPMGAQICPDINLTRPPFYFRKRASNQPSEPNAGCCAGGFD